MELTITTIGEKVEIDWTAKEVEGSLSRTGVRVLGLKDEDGNIYSLENSDLEVRIGDKLVIRD